MSDEGLDPKPDHEYLGALVLADRLDQAESLNHLLVEPTILAARWPQPQRIELAPNVAADCSQAAIDNLRLEALGYAGLEHPNANVLGELDNSHAEDDRT